MSIISGENCQQAIWAASPTTTRGQPTPLSADSKGERIAYASNKSVFVRSIDNPEISKQYTQHTSQTTVARFSPSGFYVASGDVSGNIKIWDCQGEGATKGEYQIIAGRINDLAWDGDSQRIIAVGEGKERFGACITADSGNSVGEISGHNKQVTTVAIRQQRPLRAATGGDDMNLVFLHGVPFKFNTSIREKHTRYIFGTAFSPDGAFLLSVGADSRIWLYDGKTGEAQKQIGQDEHKGSIFGVSWAADSKRFVTCSADQTIKAWDVESGKVIKSWRLGEEGVVSPSHHQVGVVWPHGRKDDLIISVDLDGNLNYLKIDQDIPVRIVRGHQKNITALTATSDATTLWTGSSDGRICHWDESRGAASKPDGESHAAYISGLAASPSSGRVYSISWDDTMRTIDSSTISFAGTPPSKLSSQPRSVTVASSGTTIVATLSSIEAYSKDGTVDSSTPTSYTPTSIAASESLVVVGDEQKSLHVYSLSGSKLTHTKTLSSQFPSNPSTIAFSVDGSHVAVGLSDGKIHVLKTSDWSVVTTRWSGHTARVASLSWSNDGKYAVSGSLDTNVQVWSLASPGNRVKYLNAHKEGVSGVAWVGTDSFVSTGADAAVKVWKTSGLK